MPDTLEVLLNEISSFDSQTSDDHYSRRIYDFFITVDEFDDQLAFELGEALDSKHMHSSAFHVWNQLALSYWLISQDDYFRCSIRALRSTSLSSQHYLAPIYLLNLINDSLSLISSVHEQAENSMSIELVLGQSLGFNYPCRYGDDCVPQIGLDSALDVLRNLRTSYVEPMWLIPNLGISGFRFNRFVEIVNAFDHAIAILLNEKIRQENKTLPLSAIVSFPNAWLRTIHPDDPDFKLGV